MSDLHKSFICQNCFKTFRLYVQVKMDMETFGWMSSFKKFGWVSNFRKCGSDDCFNIICPTCRNLKNWCDYHYKNRSMIKNT